MGSGVRWHSRGVRRRKTIFEQMHERQEAMCEPPVAPFVDEDKWDLVRWLMKNVMQMATDEFLKMKGVCHG